MTMDTFEPLHSSAAQSFAYWGDRTGWLIVLGQHRDSDALERSNWEVISDDLMTRYPDDVAIERFSNWAVGWSESLLVRPGSPALGAAKTWHDKLAQYPVADEDHYSMLEANEEWCVRCDSAMAIEHPTTQCKRFRSENDADEIRWSWKHRRDH